MIPNITSLVSTYSKIFSTFLYHSVIYCISLGLIILAPPPRATFVKQMYSASKPNFPPSSQE